MTESLGFAVGLTGIALLLVSVEQVRLSWTLLLLGFVVISLGMAVRAGALFVLPALAVWAFFATRGMPWPRRWRVLLLAALALGAGLALQLFLVYALGSDPRNTGGNFAVSLYGLSTGSRDWSQAYRDFQPLFRTESEATAFAQIQAAAIVNIRDHPMVFLQSLVDAGGAFNQNLFSIGLMQRFNDALTFLFWIGVVVSLYGRRHRALTLLLALAVGEFLAAPLVFDTAGHRVFAVTVAARLAIAAIGLAWIIGALTQLRLSTFTAPAGPPMPGDRHAKSIAVGLALILLTMALIPITPLAKAFRLQRVPGSGTCENDELEVVARPGRESIEMTFGERDSPLVDGPLGVPLGRLELDPVARQAWWLAEFQPQSPGTTLLYLVQRSGGSMGAVVPAYTRVPIPRLYGELVSFCLVAESSPSVKLGDAAFYHVTRWASMTTTQPGAK